MNLSGFSENAPPTFSISVFLTFRSFEFFFLYFPLCRDCSPSLSACSTSLSPSYCNFLKVSLVAISKIKRSYLRRRECWRSGLLFGFRSLNCHIWRRGRPRSKKKKNWKKRRENSNEESGTLETASKKSRFESCRAFEVLSRFSYFCQDSISKFLLVARSIPPLTLEWETNSWRQFWAKTHTSPDTPSLSRCCFATKSTKHPRHLQNHS